METPLPPNYANLFMDDFEQNLLHDYFLKNWIIAFRMVSFYWWYSLHMNSLDHFISFTQNYSNSTKRKSKIKFQYSYLNQKSLYSWFNSFFKTYKIMDNAFTKPADSHLVILENCSRSGKLRTNVRLNLV